MGKNKRKKENQKLIRNQNKRRKNKKNKDSNMAWWNGKHTTGTKNGTGSGLKTKPVETTQNGTLSVMLYKQSTLDEIAAICKPKANASEFQVHCRGAQLFIQKPDSDKRLVFTIPTYYFNMPQKVSSGSVDFNLDEVAEISNQIAPMSVKMVEEIAAKFPIDFFKELGFEVSVRELEMGSLHRHPGDFGFSGTDMDNQVEKPGVIFRNLKCTDKVQVDSVMYIPGNHVKIVTTETRVVTVEPSADEGIEGTYSEAPTLCYIIQDKIEPLVGFQEFFGANVVPEDHTIDFKIDKYKVEDDYPEIAEILTAFLKEIDYEPQLIVDPDLIEQEYSYYKPVKPYNYNKRHGAHEYGNEFYESYLEGDDEFDVVINPMKNANTVITNKATPAKVLEVRPTWRKTQALGLLTAKGIDVKANADITGDASDKDVIAIVTEFKDKDISDAVIRSFFTTCDYPVASLGLYYTNLTKIADI